MDSNDLFEYKNNIREHIKNIDYYIETIQNEFKDEASQK